MTTTAAISLPTKTTTQRVGLWVALVAFVACLWIEIPGLEPVGVRMLGIFIAAVALWVTEAIPLAATGVGIILAQVLLISDDALLPVPDDAATSASFFATLANPVLILFMGGFLIADGAAKYGLDKNLAALMLRPFRGGARTVMLGLMLITALLSMFMSNTATTATMFAVLIPIIASMTDPRARTGITLSVPVAANLGGAGTPVGSPPNAIAIGALARNGVHLTFTDWMFMAMPFVIVSLAYAWVLLALLFVPRDAPLHVDTSVDFRRTPAAVTFYGIAGATVLLWMTEPLHGIPAAVVGFVPVVLLLATGVMTGEDIKQLSWPVLWLVAGGIALGAGVGATGLDEWLLGGVDWGALGSVAFLVALCLIAVVTGTFISNSATANLLIPLVLGPGLVVATGDLTLGVMIALACALGFALPISTPPNAIAYATGFVPQRSLILVGGTIGVFGAVLLAVGLPPLWALMGLT